MYHSAHEHAMEQSHLNLLIAVLSSHRLLICEWQNLTTSGKLPAQCKLQHSNNNLDLMKFNGKYFLAFRTAPNHFASKKAVLYVVSSTDLESWTYETEIHIECVVVNGKARFA